MINWTILPSQRQRKPLPAAKLRISKSYQDNQLGFFHCRTCQWGDAYRNPSHMASDQRVLGAICLWCPCHSRRRNRQRWTLQEHKKHSKTSSKLWSCYSLGEFGLVGCFRNELQVCRVWGEPQMEEELRREGDEGLMIPEPFERNRAAPFFSNRRRNSLWRLIYKWLIRGWFECRKRCLSTSKLPLKCVVDSNLISR